MPENDNRTRRELEAALRGLLGQKPLGQLRVRELTERCGLRRQSFYYHFTDIYDLFAWCLSRERALLLDRLEDCLTWRQAFLALLNRASEERAFYRAALDRGGQAGLGELVPLEEVLETVQVYYRNRCGVQPDRAEEERDHRCGRLPIRGNHPLGQIVPGPHLRQTPPVHQLLEAVVGGGAGDVQQGADVVPGYPALLTDGGGNWALSPGAEGAVHPQVPGQGHNLLRQQSRLPGQPEGSPGGAAPPGSSIWRRRSFSCSFSGGTENETRRPAYAGRLVPGISV